jgi:ADP-ribose pyrophosphatase YjhB (NUDIX family)
VSVAAGPVIAVGAVVVKDGTLLMVRRKNEPGQGLWSIPGGRLELGEYISAAVAREVKEETGLDVEVLELLGIFEVPGDPHYVMLDHIASHDGDDEPVAGDDVDDVRWVPFGGISELPCTPRLEETLRAWGVFEGTDQQTN